MEICIFPLSFQEFLYFHGFEIKERKSTLGGKRKPLENVVYFELLRRGYDMTIGKVDQAEVDFIATKPDQKPYIQVTESMISPEVRRRELAPLEKIADNYEKLILSLDVGAETSYEGIRGMNFVE